MGFSFKPPINIDLKNTKSTITLDTEVFPPETNKTTTVGRFRQKKYHIQCNGKGEMGFYVLKDPIEQLRELSKLRDEGVITDKDFEQKKKELLKKIK